MQVVERINSPNSTVESISSINNSINHNHNTQPKLKLVWQTEWRNGQERVFSQWVEDK